MDNNNILQKLEGLESRYEEVSTLITDPEVIADQSRYVKLTKEYKDLGDIMAARKRYIDCLNAIKEAKAGKIEYRLDKQNIIHVPVGKASFGAEKLMANLDTVLEAIAKAKPAAAKGQYFKSATIATTMGPGVRVATNKYGV